MEALNVAVPGPLTWLQAPLPTLGVFPPSAAVVALPVPHRFCVPPTVAVVGVWFTVTLAVLALAVQPTESVTVTV